MSLVTKNKVIVDQAGQILRGTHLISKEDQESDKAWAIVAQEYAEHQDSISLARALVSLINSIIYHRKAAFILTRDNFSRICRTDKNWLKPLGFSNGNWKTFLYEASGIIKAVKKAKNPKSGREIYIYQVVMPAVLDLLCANVDQQVQEAVDLIESPGFSFSDGGLDEGSDEKEKAKQNLNEKLSTSAEAVCIEDPRKPSVQKEENIQSYSSLVSSLGSLLLAETATICNFLLAKNDNSEVLAGILSHILKFKSATEKQHRIAKGRLSKFYESGGRVEVSETTKNEIIALASTFESCNLIKTDFQMRVAALAFEHCIPLEDASDVALNEYLLCRVGQK